MNWLAGCLPSMNRFSFCEPTFVGHYTRDLRPRWLVLLPTDDKNPKLNDASRNPANHPGTDVFF